MLSEGPTRQRLLRRGVFFRLLFDLPTRSEELQMRIGLTLAPASQEKVPRRVIAAIAGLIGLVYRPYAMDAGVRLSL